MAILQDFRRELDEALVSNDTVHQIADNQYLVLSSSCPDHFHLVTVFETDELTAGLRAMPSDSSARAVTIFPPCTCPHGRAGLARLVRQDGKVQLTPGCCHHMKTVARAVSPDEKE
jgi:hypothetical protein